MSRITETLQRIVGLSKELSEKADRWYCDCHEPASRLDISKHEYEQDIILPDAFKECLTVSNGFMVDFCGQVGYLKLNGLKNTGAAIIDGERHIPDKQCIGWLRGRCLYYDHHNGDFFIENERYKYDLITDFCQEVLDPAEAYLRKQLERSARKYELLDKQKDNPFREQYDELVSFNKEDTNVYLYPPASQEEISRWEQEHGITLPQEYKDWLLLSDGTFFNGFDVYSLDTLSEHLDETEEYEGDTYIFLASLTGCCDFFMGNVKTGAAMVLTEEFDWEDGEDTLIEYLNDKIEWYKEDQGLE